MTSLHQRLFTTLNTYFSVPEITEHCYAINDSSAQRAPLTCLATGPEITAASPSLSPGHALLSSYRPASVTRGSVRLNTRRYRHS